MFAGKGFSHPPPGAYDALVYKGVIDCSTNPNYPAADAGHTYKVSVAGKIGGASGAVVTIGDLIICNTDGIAAGTQAAVGANWNVIQGNLDMDSPGPIGKTTPAEGWFSPSASKGPAIITTFAGTVSTSGSSTTITFTSAADAILAGYNATNPVLGTTLVTTAFNQASVTRYIVSWTNATACVVDTACTLAASSTLASVQLPIATFINSAGVTQGWMSADGYIWFVTNIVRQLGVGDSGVLYDLYSNTGSAADRHWRIVNGSSARGALEFMTGTSYGAAPNTTSRFMIDVSGNILTGSLTAAGISAAKVLAMGSGTMPTTFVADAATIGVKDVGAVAGQAGFHMDNEAGESAPVGFAVPPERIKASSVSLTLADLSGKLVNNYAQAGNVIYTLPAAAVNLACDFIAGITAAFYTRFTSVGSNVIYLDGVVGAAAGSVQVASVAAGNAISLRTFQTGAATWAWFITTVSGPWVAL